MTLIKKIFVKIAFYTFKGLEALGKGFGKILPYFTQPFKFLGSKIGRYVILPIYKAQIFIKRKILNFYSPAQSKVFLFLTKKYIVHFVIIFLVIFVFGSNLQAKEVRTENFGENTIVFSMFNDEKNYELVEETAVFKPQEKVLSYLDKTSQVENVKVVADNFAVTEEQLAEDLSAITQGGAALVKPNITETEYSTASRSKIIEHTVEEGETISTIAERYGISTNTVLWANDLSESSIIKPGITLKILPVTGVAHVVVKGDSVKSLAQKYEVEEEKIIEYNKLSEDGRIVLGKELILPGGIKPRVYATKQTYSSIPNVSLKNLFVSPTQADISTKTKGSSTGTGSMAWPTTWRVITQYYHLGHLGLDIDGDYNSPIYAAEAGTVIWAGWKNGYGNTYIVDHGNGYQTLYAHLSKYFATQGQYVARGETLGMMGTTGWSTGTHLHFEVRVNGAKKNPLNYIK